MDDQAALNVSVYLPGEDGELRGKLVESYSCTGYTEALDRIKVPKGYTGKVNVRIEYSTGIGCWVFIDEANCLLKS